ncbi:MAG: hypothetical protein Kow0081_2010 [Candidatus Dojkabacteria bacterium]
MNVEECKQLLENLRQGTTKFLISYALDDDVIDPKKVISFVEMLTEILRDSAESRLIVKEFANGGHSVLSTPSNLKEVQNSLAQMKR